MIDDFSKGVVKKGAVKVFEVFPLAPNEGRSLRSDQRKRSPSCSGDRAAEEDKRVREKFLKAEAR